MDEIQKILIETGRKDLAQQYYEKVAAAQYDVEEREAKSLKSFAKDLEKTSKSMDRLSRAFNKKVAKAAARVYKHIDAALVII